MSCSQVLAFCEVLIELYEKKHGIPNKLLHAVALAESGRSVPGRGMVAWPWTINAEGKPFVFETKAEAVSKVKELRRQGIESIDVGCMQVNLKYHPEAFNNLEDAFDPEHNIAYAAQFLKQKSLDQGGWANAVAHYHSAIPSVHAPYKSRVLQIWDRVKEASDTLTDVLTPLPLQKQFQPRIVRLVDTGRRVPLHVRYSVNGGRFSPPSNESISANKGGISLSKRFLNIRQKGSLIHAQAGQGAKVIKVAGPSSRSGSLIGSRKIFKLTR